MNDMITVHASSLDGIVEVRVGRDVDEAFRTTCDRIGLRVESAAAGLPPEGSVYTLDAAATMRVVEKLKGVALILLPGTTMVEL